MRIWQQIRTLFILQGLLLASALFTLFKVPSVYTYPDDDPNTHPFFCNDYLPWAICVTNIEITLNTYIYFLIEHLILVGFSLYMWKEAWRNHTALCIFFVIHVIDTLDYLVFYGQTWFYVAPYYPINWNVIKPAIFALAIINEVLLIKERESMLR